MKLREKCIVASLIAMFALIGFAAPLRAQSFAPDSGSQANAGRASDGEIAEIIVTAEKRSTNLQKAPVAITAVSGDALESRGIYNLQQAQVLAPALHLGEEGTSTQVFLRGVGADHDSVNIEPQVAVNFNGIYVPREATGGTNLFDVQDLEILPGPQGTLYGRSATGGVININFKRPGQSFGGEALAEYGNYSYGHVFSAIDLPANDWAKFRLAGNYVKEDGYMQTGSGAVDDVGFRASALLTPIEPLSAYLWGSFVNHRGSEPNAVNYPFLNISHPYNDIQPACCQPFGPIGVYPLNEDVYMAGGQIDYTTAKFAISYIPGYANVSFKGGEGLGGTPLQYQYRIRQESNELRLTADNMWVKTLVGLYQFDQTYRDYLWQLPIGNVYNIPYSKEDGAAVYTREIISVTSAFRVTLGGRYSSTNRRANGSEFLGPGAPTPPYSFAETYNHFDWTAGIEADVAANSMAYATIQTGYNPGTYNTSPSVPLLPKGFLPAKLLSYTVGIKNRFFGNKLQLNVEGYYYDYTDLLVAAFNVLTGQEVVQNAKKVEIFGTQLDVRYALSSHIDLYASGNFLHAENKDFVIQQLVGPPLNLNGLTAADSPHFSFNAGASQWISLPGGAKLTGQVDTHRDSSLYSQFDHFPGTYVKAYEKTDLSLTYSPLGEQWSIAGWVRNVENTVHVTTAGSGGIPGPGAAILDRPRTYGVRVTYKF